MSITQIPGNQVLDGGITEADVNDSTVPAKIHAASAKGSFSDNDEIGIIDSDASNVLKKNLWSVVKSALKIYFDGIYDVLRSIVTGAEIDTGTDNTKIVTAKSIADAKIVKAPASSTDGHVAFFDGVSGKLLKDNGITLSGSNTGDQALPTDATITTTDVITNDVSTSKHGFAPKAVAPASGNLNIYGIANAETAITNKLLLDATSPSTQAFSDSAAAGTSLKAARVDHKHAMPASPTISDATISITDIATNNASTTAHGFAPKATAPAAGNLNVEGIANAETVRTDKLLLDATSPSTQAFGDSAAAGTSLKAARIDHKHAMPASPTLPTDATLSFTDVTTNNANTTNHGFAPKPVAPVANALNVPAITNGETVLTNKTILDQSTTPSTQAYGDAAAIGTSLIAAHADHQHAMPAAITDATISSTDVATNDASTTKHGWLIKLTAPATGLINFIGIAYGETLATCKALFDVTAPSTQAFGDSAAVGSATTAARRDHKHAMPANPVDAATVKGPSSATDGHVAMFDGTTGKLLKDGGAAGSGDMVLASTQTISGEKDFNDSTLCLNGSSSGKLTLKAPAAASTYVATLPAATDTLVCLGLAQTLTNKTLTTPIISSISNTGTLTLPSSTDTLVGQATTDTLTNKRKQPRVDSQASTSSITPEISTYDLFVRTALAVGITINNHSTSTPVDGEQMKFRLYSASAQTIAFGNKYIAGQDALPTTTVAGKWITFLFEWINSTSQWYLLTVNNQA